MELLKVGKEKRLYTRIPIFTGRLYKIDVRHTDYNIKVKLKFHKRLKVTLKE